MSGLDHREGVVSPGLLWSTGVGLAFLFCTSYYWLDLRLAQAPHLRTYDFSLPLDARIPFFPWAVWLYALYYPFCFAVLPLLSARERFRRVALAYILEFALAILCFLLFPSRVIRPPVPGGGFTEQALRFLYALDPGYNVFPSLHVANATLVAWVYVRYRSSLVGPVLALTLLITASTVIIKAHYLLDLPAGVALAVLAIWFSWSGATDREG